MLKGMSLRGTLSTMSAEDVLEWVARRRLVGADHVRAARGRAQPRGRGRLDRVGELESHATSSSAMILVRSGLVAERALADALEARAETGVPLGKVLLMSGLITETRPRGNSRDEDPRDRDAT